MFEYRILYDRELGKYVVEEVVDGSVQFAQTFNVWSEMLTWLNSLDRVERLLGVLGLPGA